MKVAVGFFDGVHLGHQAILKGADAALTFRNHPLTVLAPERAPRLIMSPGERVAAIKACGVKDVTMLDFTTELANLPPGEFASRFLSSSGFCLPSSPLLSSVRCGQNWRFGKGGAGDADFLRRLGFDVAVVSYAVYKDEPISSSRIRACLERGEIEDANVMLGRRFQVSGFRFQGKGVGAKLGYPTVNLKLETCNLKLPFGVYEVAIGAQTAIANYGLAPTMGDKSWKAPVLEVHLLDNRTIEQSEQPNNLSVSFVRFIRPERKFDSVQDLQRQIALDCSEVAMRRTESGVSVQGLFRNFSG